MKLQQQIKQDLTAAMKAKDKKKKLEKTVQ